MSTFQNFRGRVRREDRSITAWQCDRICLSALRFTEAGEKKFDMEIPDISSLPALIE